MKTLNDILNRKKPLVIEGEKIENTFVKPLPVSKFNLIKDIQNGSEDDKIQAMKDLILFSVVDNDNKQAINEDDLSINDLMLFVDAIIEANGLNEGKSNTDE